MSSTRSENKTKPLPPLAAVYQEPDVGSTEPEHPHLVTLAEAMSQWPDIFDKAAWTDFFLRESISGDSPELTQPTAESPTAPAVWVYFTPNELDALRTEYGVSNNPATSRELAVTQRSYEHLLNQVHAISPHFSDPVSLRWLVLAANEAEIKQEVLQFKPADQARLIQLLTKLKLQAIRTLIQGSELRGFQLFKADVELDSALIQLLEADAPELLPLLQSSLMARSQIFAETVSYLTLTAQILKERFERYLAPLFDKTIGSWISQLANQLAWLTKSEVDRLPAQLNIKMQQPLDDFQLKVALSDLQKLARTYFLLSDSPFPEL